MSAPRVFGYVVQRGDGDDVQWFAGFHERETQWVRDHELAEQTCRNQCTAIARGNSARVVRLVSADDTAAEIANLRPLLVRARESLDWMADRGPDTDRDGALLVDIDAALAETEGAT